MEQLHIFDSSKKRYFEILPEYQQKVEKQMADDDLKSFNEILFSCHSCAIEGNSYTVNDSRALYELGLSSIPQGKTLAESMEMLDHFHAYETMLDSLQEPMSEELLKKLHFQLTEHTIAYLHKGAKAGEYTDTDMCAGDTIFGDHEVLVAQVPRLLEATEKAIQDGLPAMEVAARFHGFFEHLHPFRDGNGRVGRLMSNYILLRCGLPLLIIPIEKREEYIQCLKLFRKDSQEYLIDFFYRTAVEQMESCLSQKKAASKKMFFMF